MLQGSTRVNQSNRIYTQKLNKILARRAREPVLLRASPAYGILSACKNNDPDLLILDRGNRRFTVFGLGSDVWSQVRRGCHKPLLELKKVN